MAVPHPIPYQGSKRRLAPLILEFFPHDVEALIEPFAGSAAVSLAALRLKKTNSVWLNDINGPLMDLWRSIVHAPAELADQYRTLWNAQLGDEKAYYRKVRDEFNQTQRPHLFLYLLARCVKASVRYNAYGQFNQGPDNRRKGTHPDTMETHIRKAAQLMRGRVEIYQEDYRTVIERAGPRDLVYMDPPYQGVSLTRDPRYIANLGFAEFANALADLNRRGISYIVSYDGKLGSMSYGEPLPASLQLRHIEVHAGRSSQATLLGRTDATCESLYLSPALLERIDRKPEMCPPVRPEQAGLFAGLKR